MCIHTLLSDFQRDFGVSNVHSSLKWEPLLECGDFTYYGRFKTTLLCPVDGLRGCINSGLYISDIGRCAKWVEGVKDGI